MKKTKVIITSAGAGPGIAVIKGLRAQHELSLEVIAADMDITAAGLHLADSFVVTPAVNNNSFVDFMLGYCRERQVDFIVPIFDIETPFFASNKARFRQEAGVEVLVNDYGTVVRCNDKQETYAHCLNNNVLVPRIYSSGDIKNGSFHFPLILKPVAGIGSKGVKKIEKDMELQSILPLSSVVFLQEYIEGTEYTIDTLSDFQAQCLVAVPRERIVVKAGQTVKGKTVKDERLMSYGKKIAELFSLKGVGCIQCKVANGKIYLIEVNSRHGTGLSLSIGAGVHLPLLHLKLAMGLKIEKEELDFKDNYFMSRYWEEIFLDGAVVESYRGNCFRVE